jgi:hypothetical protein
MARHFGDWLRGFKWFRGEPETCRVVDDSRIPMFVSNSGAGRTSGLEFEQHTLAKFFDLRGGLVTRLLIDLDRDLALADLGPEE